MALTVTAAAGTLSVGAAQGQFSVVPGAVGYMPQALTVSGNEITDASRAIGTSGDGRTNDSSFGIWPAATNLALQSNHLNTAPWTVQGLTVAEGGATDPYGGNTANLLTLTNVSFLNQQFTVTPGTAMVASFYARKGTCSAVMWGVFDTTHSAYITGPTNYTAQINTSTYTLIQASFTVPVGCTALQIYVEADGGAPSGTVAVWQVQLETGPVATPRINTTTTTATRAAARVQLSADYLSPVQGWAAFRLRMGWASTVAVSSGSPVVFAWTDGTSTNRLIVYFNVGAGCWAFESDAGGSSPSVVVADTFAAGALRYLEIVWTATTFAINLNNTGWVTTPRTFMQIGLLTTLDLLTMGGGLPLVGDILSACFGTGTAPDPAMLNALTRDPTVTDFSHANNATVIWTADTTTALMGAAV